MSLGRKAMQKTLTSLKSSMLLNLDYWVETSKATAETLSKIEPPSAEGKFIAVQLGQIITQQSTVDGMVIRNLMDYITALEAYVSDLDDTFDELLQGAKKKAEEEAKKQPKVPKDFYR